jgi:hypothetical protein
LVGILHNITITFCSQGIKAFAFNFSVVIPGPNAILNVPIYIFSENKTLSLCDDKTEIDIAKGMIKYDIEVSYDNLKKCNSLIY